MKTPDNNISHYILSCLLPVLLLLPLVVSSGCRGSYHDDPRLRNIGTKLSDRSLPSSEALPLLDSLEKIPDTDLSEGERHYRDFLTIKASDKGYRRHASDSLYLTVKDYFSSHHSREMLPEVLYYGGRVYSDMGNYPIALQYFEEALDILSTSDNNETKGNIMLRSSVCSQTGRLLNDIRLYAEAADYLEKAIEYEKIVNDTTSLAYDHQLLAMIQLHQESFDKAKRNFMISNQFSNDSNISYTNEAYLSYIDMIKGDTLSSLKRIRKAIDNGPGYAMPTICGYAADIYQAVEETDSAIKYSKRIIDLEDSYNREQGYQRLLSDSLICHLPNDTVQLYIKEYKQLLDSYYNENENNSVIMRNSMFNYDVNERERAKAEEKLTELKSRLNKIGIALICMLICFGGMILFFKYRRLKSYIKYIAVFNKLSFLENRVRHVSQKGPLMIEHDHSIGRTYEIKIPLSLPLYRKESIECKESIESRIDKLIKGLDENEIKLDRISPQLLKSEPYKELQSKINKNKTLTENHKFWKELEGAVTCAYPDFVATWELLIGEKAKDLDLPIMLLLKCRVPLKNISRLIGRSNSALTKRRKRLSRLLFDRDLDLTKFDTLIALI